MSVRGFGRITPVQMDMLRLVGYGIKGRSAILPESPGERKANIELGRSALVKLTGRDFGDDLQQWHTHLSSRKDLGYTHTFGYAGVKKAVLMGMSDVVRRKALEEG